MKLEVPDRYKHLWTQQVFDDDWAHRDILNINGIKIPEYRGVRDPGKYYKPAIFETIQKNRKDWYSKQILDFGTGTGFNNILLAKEGYQVEGIENNNATIVGTIYTMMLNDVYYDIHLGSVGTINEIPYDILTLNNMFYGGDMTAYRWCSLILKERYYGKEVLVYDYQANVEKILDKFIEKYVEKLDE